MPAKYVKDSDSYSIHLVIFAQLKPSSTPQITSSDFPKPTSQNQYTQAPYLVPCVPVKYLDSFAMYPFFQKTLQFMFYE